MFKKSGCASADGGCLLTTLLLCFLFAFSTVTGSSSTNACTNKASIAEMNESYSNYEYNIGQNQIEDLIVDSILILEKEPKENLKAIKMLEKASSSGSAMATFLLCREKRNGLPMMILPLSTYSFNTIAAPSFSALEILNPLYERLRLQLEENSLFPTARHYASANSSFQFKRPLLPSLGIYSEAYNLHYRALAFSNSREQWYISYMNEKRQTRSLPLTQSPRMAEQQQHQQHQQQYHYQQQKQQQEFSYRKPPKSPTITHIPSFTSPQTTALDISSMNIGGFDEKDYLKIDKDLIGQQMKLDEEKRRQMILRQQQQGLFGGRRRSTSDDYSERRRQHNGIAAIDYRQHVVIAPPSKQVSFLDPNNGYF